MIASDINYGGLSFEDLFIRLHRIGLIQGEIHPNYVSRDVKDPTLNQFSLDARLALDKKAEFEAQLLNLQYLHAALYREFELLKQKEAKFSDDNLELIVSRFQQFIKSQRRLTTAGAVFGVLGTLSCALVGLTLFAIIPIIIFMTLCLLTFLSKSVRESRSDTGKNLESAFRAKCLEFDKAYLACLIQLNLQQSPQKIVEFFSLPKLLEEGVWSSEIQLNNTLSQVQIEGISKELASFVDRKLELELLAAVLKNNDRPLARRVADGVKDVDFLRDTDCVNYSGFMSRLSDSYSLLVLIPPVVMTVLLVGLAAAFVCPPVAIALSILLVVMVSGASVGYLRSKPLEANAKKVLRAPVEESYRNKLQSYKQDLNALFGKVAGISASSERSLGSEQQGDAVEPAVVFYNAAGPEGPSRGLSSSLGCD